MAAIEVFQKCFAIKYDGTNGTEIAALLGTNVVSDNGTVLQLEVFGDPTPLNKWIIWIPGITGPNGPLSSPMFWQPLDDYTDFFAAAPVKSLVGFGSASVSASALGQANRQFDVDLNRDMGGTSYEVVAILAGGSGHAVDSAVALDADTARVIIDSAALSEDATLTVLAIG